MEFRNGDEPTMAEVEAAMAVSDAPVAKVKETGKRPP
jgi:hypothetical protein